jgi:hypothetical protein
MAQRALLEIGGLSVMVCEFLLFYKQILYEWYCNCE